MGTLQNITVAGLVADLGLTGHKGITAARNSGDHTKLDVTVTPPAWVLLGGGTLFTTDLTDTTVQAPTTDGSYHLYVDAVAQVTATVPSWSIAATAPSANALAIADVTVASHVISAATVRDEGLRSLPVQASALPSPPPQAGVPVLHGPYVVDYTDIPHDGDTKTLWTPAIGDVLLRLCADGQSGQFWDHGNLYVGQNVDGTVIPPHNVLTDAVSFPGAGHYPDAYWANFDPAIYGQGYDAAGHQRQGTAIVFHTSDPVQIQLAQTGGTDPTQGSVSLYALIARPVAP